METRIYKIVTAAQWAQAEKAKLFAGAPIDIADGYIHLSTAAQVRETAAKHFSGQPGLMLVAIDTSALSHPLKWEVSRGGALFPHLYGPLSMQAVVSVCQLPLGANGQHLFPSEIEI